MLQTFQLQLTIIALSLFDTEVTISYMSKVCFDKLQPKPVLVQMHTYKVNGANGNSLGPLRTTT